MGERRAPVPTRHSPLMRLAEPFPIKLDLAERACATRPTRLTERNGHPPWRALANLKA